MSALRCTITFPTLKGKERVTCGRLLSDPCGICRAFDQCKDEWSVIFNEYRDKPRVAVEGDL